MAYIRYSPLGRRVDSQREYFEDLILKVLFDAYFGMFSNADIPVSLRLLSQSAGLDIQRTRAICDYLVKKSLVERVISGQQPFYKISPEGIRLVEIEQR
ncbi:hypothetical protein HY768_02385 [candidate division TA06 bacterium]|uniref:Uncharacterized protein n=1 Tax=candidate division TA06 bacterium TaxID=2250710 RepID=A0A933I7I9_UNCT6|nr:hypothetical protein [candidate division TA06 bacterium]